MKILGIETSCDETAASVVEDGKKILSNVVVSQIDIFKEYGGVIPEIASRSHLEAIQPVIKKAMTNFSWNDIDAIAVTHTPGLLGSLLIGTLTARTLAILHNKPLYAVHHLKSHIYANWLTLGTEWKISTNALRNIKTRPERPGACPQDTCADFSLSSQAEQPGACPKDTCSIFPSHPSFPLLAMVISGGHTQIIYMRAHNEFEIIGTTKDDAIGECFDKVAKILGLQYPGGPAISKAAKSGDPGKYTFPHPLKNSLDFSFSGLKTAVLREVQKEVWKPISYPSHELAKLLNEQQISDFAASFEKTAVDIILEKLSLALKEHEISSLVFAGGVSANEKLRERATKRFGKILPVFFPDPKLSGDNGAMVAAAAFYEIKSGVPPTDPYTLDIYPRSVIK